MTRIVTAALALALTASSAWADSPRERYGFCLADSTAVAQRGEHRLRPILRAVDRTCAGARSAVLRQEGRAAADGIRATRLQARFPGDEPAGLNMRVRALPRS